jgi:hypothetical protein
MIVIGDGDPNRGSCLSGRLTSSIRPIPMYQIPSYRYIGTHIKRFPPPIIKFPFDLCIFQRIWTFAFVMGFGVKEPKTVFGEHVPGTSLLVDIGNGNVELADHSTLKHAPGKNSDIILVPQPSDSPNDPLVSDTVIKCAEEPKLIAL